MRTARLAKWSGSPEPNAENKAERVRKDVKLVRKILGSEEFLVWLQDKVSYIDITN
jgi:hypothetical protein